MQSRHSASLLMVSSLLAMLGSGCASTAGKARPLSAVAKPETLSQYTKLSVTTSADGDAILMTDRDRERITALITQKIRSRAPDRFASFGAPATDPGTLHVTIAFTRYEDGNAFSRLVQAGLGQIHIDAEVALEDRSRHEVIAKFDVTKTFAWGGVYGAATGIKDVEEGFAEAVAKAVLGESQD